METTSSFSKEMFDLEACKALLLDAFILFDESVLMSIGREEVIREDITHWWTWNELQPIIQCHIFLFKNAQHIPLKNYKYAIDAYLELVRFLHIGYASAAASFYKLVATLVIDRFLQMEAFDITQGDLGKLLSKHQLTEANLPLLKLNRKGNWEFIDHSIFEYFLALNQYEEKRFNSFDYQFYLYYRFLKELYFKHHAEDKISNIKGAIFLLYEEWESIAEQELWRIEIAASLRLYENIAENDLYGFRNVEHLQFINIQEPIQLPDLSELFYLQRVEFKDIQIDSFTELYRVLGLYKLYFENVKITNFPQLIDLCNKRGLILEKGVSWEVLSQQEYSTFEVSKISFEVRRDLR